MKIITLPSSISHEIAFQDWINHFQAGDAAKSCLNLNSPNFHTPPAPAVVWDCECKRNLQILLSETKCTKEMIDFWMIRKWNWESLSGSLTWPSITSVLSGDLELEDRFPQFWPFSTYHILRLIACVLFSNWSLNCGSSEEVTDFEWWRNPKTNFLPSIWPSITNVLIWGLSLYYKSFGDS